MKHKSVIGGLFEAIGYVLVFLAIQIVVNTIVGIGSAMAAGQSFAVAGKGVASGSYGLDTTATIVSSVVSSLLTLWLFFRMKWAMWSKSYLSMRPWDVLFWICVLAFGLIIPSLWLQERLNVEMPEQMERLHHRDARIMTAVVGKPTAELAASYFEMTTVSMADRLKMKINRIRLVNKKRMALVEPSEYLRKIEG